MIKVEFVNKNLIEECDCKTVKQIFKKYDLKDDAYIVVRDGELLTEDDRLNDGEHIKVIPVVSGG